MFSVLKGLAEMPLEEKTFLGRGHTVPNGQSMTAERDLDPVVTRGGLR